MSIKKIIENYFIAARDIKDYNNDNNDDPTDELNYYNLLDKTDVYKFQFCMAVIMSSNLYYSNYFINFFFTELSRTKLLLNYLSELISYDTILTKQLNTIILGLILILRNHDQLNKLDKQMIIELINLTFKLLCRQKREESTKLKFELDNELDCQFLHEDEHDDETDE